MGALVWALVLAPPPTDLEFLESSLRVALASVPWNEFPDTISIIRKSGGGQWAWLAEQVLSQDAVSAGLTVGQGKGASLVCRVGELKLSYHGVKTWFFQENKVERRARVHIYLSLLGRDSVLLWSQSLALQRADTLSEKWLKEIRVEGLSPSVNQGSNQGGLAAAVLTAGALGGLLYLLYAFESQ